MTKGRSILFFLLILVTIVGAAPILAQDGEEDWDMYIRRDYVEDLTLDGSGALTGDVLEPGRRALTDGKPIHWDFGDGYNAIGTLSPDQVYGNHGLCDVTLIVTDTQGGMGDDPLLDTVLNAAPSVNAGPDQRGLLGEPITFNGSFTDPDPDDTHTIEWDTGDGAIITGKLAFNYTYQTVGIYTATLTVTDDGGGVGSDSLIITIEQPRIYLPIVLRNLRTWDAYYEENDHWLAAYGPLASGQAYQAYPDDEDDYYYFELSSGATVNIRVESFAPTSTHGDLLLYGPATGDDRGPRITYFGQPGHSSMVLDPQSLGPGKYYIRVYVADSSHYSTSQLYTLTLTLLLGTPTLYTIDNPDGDSTYTVSWSVVPYAEDYVLEQATDSVFSDAQQIYIGNSTNYTVTGRMTGRYYYRVKARSTWGESDWSTVRLADVRWEVEPNDEIAQANGPIVSGLTYYGTFPEADPGEDQRKDYFYFDLSASHRTQLWLTNIPAGCNYDLVLRKEDTTVVAYSLQAGNANEYIDVPSLPADVYYVQIYRASGVGSTQPYHLMAAYE